MTATISSSAFEAFASDLIARFESVKQPVQAEMAHTFWDIVQSNLGEFGIDRPHTWPPLSNRSSVGRAYIRKVGRTFATLLETGALSQAIKWDGTQSDKATVSVSDSDCPYATRHQFGAPEHALPERPYFPIVGDEVLPFTMDQVLESAANELDRALKGAL